jgi:hypothetical protein
MLKMLAPIVFVLISGSASALTLEVTGGGVTFNEQAFFEPGMLVTGTTFSFRGFSGQSVTDFLPVSSVTFGFNAAELTENGMHFVGPCCDNNSTMTLSHGPWAPLPPLVVPGFQPFDAGPFDMTAHITNMLAGGFDLVGHGIVHVDRFSVPIRNGLSESELFVTYNFVAPEPSCIVLVITGVLGLGAWHRCRRFDR